jgi:Tol biopolymer transport system component
LEWVVTAPLESSSASSYLPHRSTALAWTIAIVMALALAAIAIQSAFQGTAQPQPAPLVRFEISTPPTDDPASFAIAPNGRFVVFEGTGERGVPLLWLRPLDETSGRTLAGTDNASFPFWSSDSRSIGFFADQKLKRVDLDGGTPRELADAPSGRGGTWNRDNVILFAPTTTSGLMRVPANGGVVTPVLRGVPAQPGLQLRWPAFLPDGRHFLFFAYLTGPGAEGTYVSSLDGETPTRLVDGNTSAALAPPDHLIGVRQNQLMAWRFDSTRFSIDPEPIRMPEAVGTNSVFGLGLFSVSPNGTLVHRAGNGIQRRQLVWVDRTGRRLNTVGPVDESTYANPELAADGRRIAVSRTVDSNVDVWFLDVNRGLETRFTFDRASDANPLWSPDGNSVVFSSARDGRYDLFEKSSSGSVGAEHLLLKSEQEKRPHSWSSDGRFLLYLTYDTKTGSDLWALPMTGNKEPFPVVRTNFSETEGQLSPDGHWLAYGSNQSNRFEIYVQAFPGPGEAVQVSTGGGTQVRWNSTGKELYYVAPDSRLMAVSVTVSPDGRTIQPGTPTPLFMTHLATGGNVTGGKPQYAVASDGRFLLDTKIDDPMPSPITVVLNWTAALKK